MKTKKPSDSAVVTRYLLMPEQANPAGTAFGGSIMASIDMVASMAAQRHCEMNVVTVSIDSLSFKEPIHIGDHVVLKACVNYVGKTSMEVGVKVTREQPLTGQTQLATTAYLTFVAVDENAKPTAVPKLVPETEEEIRRHQNAKLRAQSRKELRKRITD